MSKKKCDIFCEKYTKSILTPSQKFNKTINSSHTPTWIISLLKVKKNLYSMATLYKLICCN